MPVQMGQKKYLIITLTLTTANQIKVTFKAWLISLKVKQALIYQTGYQLIHLSPHTLCLKNSWNNSVFQDFASSVFQLVREKYRSLVGGVSPAHARHKSLAGIVMTRGTANFIDFYIWLWIIEVVQYRESDSVWGEGGGGQRWRWGRCSRWRDKLWRKT